MNTILMVEDDFSLGMGIKFALEKENYKVIHAKTKTEAEKAILEDRFNLAILDITLPDGNGYELFSDIQKVQDIPVIFLTALDEEVNIVTGLDMGADDYITKPFKLRELISRINAVLRRTSNKENNDTITSDEIVIHPDKMKVYKNAKEIDVTKSEYKLLHYFMNNGLQILTKEQLLEHLWDIEGNYIDQNTLAVYMRRLRSKIEDNPSKPEYIQTVRGVGYIWNKKVL
ncbi:DNA-binding response regulator [Vallitalea longa]|uniref:Stage 0 sporulation protein A homolog n=1 Tax=Vallitalea longa TaxID=2936439 RepID=A0A9W6DFF2_9FIRM|nr:response regulator transcription factor [Vallitalea longa]GKX30525.1 DNA-binding response regulator [Vallitalea longa]